MKTEDGTPKRRSASTRRETAAADEASKKLDDLVERTRLLAEDNERQLAEMKAVDEARKLPEHTVAVTFGGAYTITTPMLRSLEKQIRSLAQSPTYELTATFDGDYSIEFQGGVEELLEVPTLETRELVALTFWFSGSSRPPLERIRFHLSATSSGPGKLDVRARDRALISDIQRIVADEMRARKNPFVATLYDWRFVIPSAAAIAFAVGFLVPQEPTIYLAYALLVGPVCMIAFYSLRRLMTRQLEFSLGLSGRKEAARHSIRKFVFGSLILATLVGVASEMGASAVSNALAGLTGSSESQQAPAEE